MSWPARPSCISSNRETERLAVAPRAFKTDGCREKCGFARSIPAFQHRNNRAVRPGRNRSVPGWMPVGDGSGTIQEKRMSRWSGTRHRTASGRIAISGYGRPFRSRTYPPRGSRWFLWTRQTARHEPRCPRVACLQERSGLKVFFVTASGVSTRRSGFILATRRNACHGNRQRPRQNTVRCVWPLCLAARSGTRENPSVARRATRCGAPAQRLRGRRLNADRCALRVNPAPRRTRLVPSGSQYHGSPHPG